MIERNRMTLLGIVVACATAIGCATYSSGVDPDLAEAVRWYTGVAGQVDNDKARSLLLEAASDGDPISRMWVARVYSRGRMGFTTNDDSARTIANAVIADVEAAAERGVPEAVFLMGTAYAEGLGKAQNDSAAAEWYRKGAELGNVLAQHNLGNVYFEGTGVEQNDSLAVFWWTKAAVQGDAVPQLRLGMMYESGRGVERDLAKARHWFGESAKRGNREAVQSLVLLGH